jgi:hypothetical protein
LAERIQRDFERISTFKYLYLYGELKAVETNVFIVGSKDRSVYRGGAISNKEEEGKSKIEANTILNKK